MELKNQQNVDAPIQRVYEALNDPEVLQACIPGCESIEKVSESGMVATVVLKIGPIKASFDGELEIKDLDAPTRYTLEFKGSGGSAGDARGSASVVLEEAGPAETIINYDVQADVNGKIAAVGGRLINSTANMLSKKFFKNLGAVLEQSA